MEGAIIAVDVSKGCSHIQGFIDLNKPISKPIKINHDLTGYKEIDNLIKLIGKENSGVIPGFVFEYTGAYHKSIVRYAINKGMKCYGISPLESAKVRKSHIRVTKTDALDCKNIANVYYSRFLREFKIEINSLKSLISLRKTLIKESTRLKNSFRKTLDVVWPLFDEYISDSIGLKTSKIINHYKHPDALKRRSLVEITSFIKNNITKGSNQIVLATKLHEYSKLVYSGVSENDEEVNNLISLLDALNDCKRRIDLIEDKMFSLVKDDKNFKLLKTIDCVSDNLAVRLISEIGDINRFQNKSQLVAYSGLDPMILQSGKNDGKHCCITRKGSSYLRSTLYLAIETMIIFRKDNVITKFLFKKKSSGLSHKASAIAACRKLLCCIYGMLTTSTSFKAN